MCQTSSSPPSRLKNLDAVVLAVADVQVAVAVGGDVVDDVELAGVGARSAPRLDQLAVRRVFVDAAVAVPVGDEQAAVRGVDGDVSASVEGITAVQLRRFVRDADGHDDLAVQRALPDGVVAVVRAVQGVVRPGGDPVSTAENSFSPRLDEIAVLVEDDHRVVAPAEDVHVVLGVSHDAGHLPPADSGRRLLPAYNHFVRELPRCPA